MCELLRASGKKRVNTVHGKNGGGGEGTGRREGDEERFILQIFKGLLRVTMEALSAWTL